MTSPTVAPSSLAPVAEADSQMSGALGGFQDIASACKTIALENMEKMADSVQAFAAVKSPTEFFELQQKMMKDNIAAAMSNGSKIATLTSAFFTASVAPLQTQMQAMRKMATDK